MMKGSCAQRRLTERSDQCHRRLLQTDSTRPLVGWQRHSKTVGNASVLFKSEYGMMLVSLKQFLSFKDML